MRKVLIIVGLIMILLACSANHDKDDRYAGEINGQLVQRAVYTYSFLNNYKALTKGNKNYQATTKEVNRLEERTWEELIRSVVISQYLEKHKLDVTQEEVIDSLLTNPPKYLTDTGIFSTKGVFDKNKYKSSIITNEPINTDLIKSNYFQSITLMKIQNQLVKDAKITKSDVKKYYENNYSTADIALLTLPLESFTPVIAEREIEIKWENDRKQYYYEPSLAIKYLIKKVEPSQQEIKKTRTTIDSLYFTLHNKGADFDSAVREYSSNLSSYPLGKMPFMALDNVPAIISSQIGTAKVGDVIMPVIKNNVWYIYKVLEKTKTMVKLQELKHPVQISQKTILKNREDFQQISDLIRQIGIEQAGFEYGWEVHSAENLNMQRVFVEGLGDLTEMINDAVNRPDGYVYSPSYNKGERFLVMVQIQENKLNKKKPLEEVRAEIYATTLYEKRLDLVSKRLRTVADKYNKIDLNQLTDVVVSELQNVSKETKLMDTQNYALNKDILSLRSSGDYTACHSDGKSGFVAVLLKQNKADKDYFNANYYIFQGEYRRDALTNYFDTWLQKEVKRAKVRKWFSMKDIYKG
ncbi:MAG: SurA N-terminal domain-containing protein [Candidatus Cloacimonadales bacterium]